MGNICCSAADAAELSTTSTDAIAAFDGTMANERKADLDAAEDVSDDFVDPSVANFDAVRQPTMTDASAAPTDENYWSDPTYRSWELPTDPQSADLVEANEPGGVPRRVPQLLRSARSARHPWHVTVRASEDIDGADGTTTGQYDRNPLAPLVLDSDNEDFDTADDSDAEVLCRNVTVHRPTSFGRPEFRDGPSLLPQHNGSRCDDHHHSDDLLLLQQLRDHPASLQNSSPGPPSVTWTRPCEATVCSSGGTPSAQVECDAAVPAHHDDGPALWEANNGNVTTP